MKKLRLLDLLSGIGGFSLGLERSGGFETVAFCEIEDFPRRVLAKHWPKVPIYDDVEKLTAARLVADGIRVDAICGGFPCQDISTAGAGAGIEGARSGLWAEYARLIRELRPRVVFVENVAALLGRGLSRVCGDLAAIGYDSEWHCIPACHVGAPHQRDRLWLIAWPGAMADAELFDRQDAMPSRRGNVADRRQTRQRRQGDGTLAGRGGVLADAARKRRGKARPYSQRPAQRTPGGRNVSNANDGHAQGVEPGRYDPIVGPESLERSLRLSTGTGAGRHTWAIEPDVGRLAHGIPDRVGQLKAYGNAVVPQIPELLGRAWMEYEAREAAL